MESGDFSRISFNDFKWINEPESWSATKETLEMSTEKSDFWQKTYYDFCFNTGHMFGVEIKDDFSLEICIEAEFNTLYDQAGLMLYWDESHWLKAGIEYNDGQPMISCVLTNGVSDWSTGIFVGDPNKFWLRLTKVADVVCVKYSADGAAWTLLRLCPLPQAGAAGGAGAAGAGAWRAGPMACSPRRRGLRARFRGLAVTAPAADILHSN